MNRRNILKTGLASVGALIVDLPKAFGGIKYTTELDQGYVYCPHIPQLEPSYGDRVKWFAYRHMSRWEMTSTPSPTEVVYTKNRIKLSQLQVDILNGTAMNWTRRQGYSFAFAAAMKYQLFLNPHSDILYVASSKRIAWTGFQTNLDSYNKGISPNIRVSTFKTFNDDVRGRTWDLIIFDSDAGLFDEQDYVYSGAHHRMPGILLHTKTRVITGRFPKSTLLYKSA